MTMNNIDYSVIRIVQAISFLLKLSERKQNKMKLIKLLWAADRYHMRKYGRTVTQTEYFALPYGPVNSLASNILKFDENYLNPTEVNYADDYLESEGEYEIRLKDDSIQFDFLSETDIESLNFAYDTFGGMDKYRLSKDITHRYPEWSNHSWVEDAKRSAPIDMLDFFNNPDNDEYFVQDPYVLELAKEDYLSHLLLARRGVK